LVLARNRGDDLTIYKIAKFSGLDRKIIRKHLGKLVEADFVHIKSYGPISVYSINCDNGPVKRIIDLFNEARLLAQAPLAAMHLYEVQA